MPHNENGARAGRSSVQDQRQWLPLLDGALAERAMEAVKEIAAELRDPPPAWTLARDVEAFDLQAVHSASLAGGHAGLAVLFTYLANAVSREEYAGLAAGFLEQAVEAVATQKMPPSLYSGFAGVAWAAEHLQTRLFEEEEGEDPDAEIDAVLLDYLDSSPWRDDYDLIAGVVGLGVYALERYPRPSAIACLERVVDRLEEIAERHTSGITWFTPPHRLPAWQLELCPNGYYNVGLAHGVPGAIALLGETYRRGVARAKAYPLLSGAVEWLLSQKLEPSADSVFPCWAGVGIAPEASRCAWCYGDPGVGAALLGAARGAQSVEWEQEALTIARRAAMRPEERAGVVDAGLCHGAAGLGHLFNRLYQATGDPALGEAARRWFERTLEMREPGEGIAGYFALLPREDDTIGRVSDPGLLTGASGVALALLAAITPIEPEWDRFLLVADLGS